MVREVGDLIEDFVLFEKKKLPHFGVAKMEEDDHDMTRAIHWPKKLELRYFRMNRISLFQVR